MKLYCLSKHPNKPCYILKFKNTTIMLDCGLDMTSLTYFLPTPVVCSPRISGLPVWRPKDGAEVLTDNELKECAGKVFIDSSPEFILPEAGITSFDEVDVILISNYQCMLALPFITEGTGFTGVIYATEPTLQMGRLFMEELVHYIDRTPRANNATKWKLAEIFNSLPQSLKSAKKSHLWRQCFRMPEVNASLARVQVVGFSQKLTLFGALHLIPVSSGYCLGSCNWTISSEYEKITYVSGSSTLTTHPKPMEQGPLRRSDVLILTGLTQTPTANPDTMLGEFCVTVALTLRNNGSVLVPCYPSGVTYDLFECLSSHLDSSGLTTIPMFFISPVADSSLAFSNIMAEWLSQAKQSKVYLPEEPFPHAQLVKNNRLKHYTSIHAGLSNDFRTPCIVFTGHPSLRFGDVVHFMEIWGKNSNNTVVFTEPDFPYLEALSPYQPLAMKAVYTPIDTSLNFSQVNKLIKELKPLHLVVPEQYTVPPLMHQHRSELVIETDVNMLVYKDSQVLTLPIRRVFERVEIDPEIATALVPTEIKPGVSVATITGMLSIMDNKHILQPLVKLPKAGGTNRKRRQEDENKYPQCYMWGSLDIDEFISQLAKNGVTDVKKEDTAAGYMLHLQTEDTLIQIEEGSTHIFCEADETLRKKLRDILLQCLSKF